MILDVVVGGQFGSEAKGHVTKRVIELRMAQFGDELHRITNIRVAGPNAGHCALDAEGRKWALRTIPMGVVIDDPRVRLHIAAGSEIDPEVLWHEIDMLEEAGLHVSSRLTIDPEATILTPEHRIQETGMQERMGSTGKGIGAARADRIMRTAKRVQDDIAFLDLLAQRHIYVTPLTMDEFVAGHSQAVIIEGTQGYGLGLHAGFYPQCTSSNTRAIDFLAMAGFNPWHSAVSGFLVWVVARVYPIRVAGNSGPLAGETSWEELGLPEEFTTVTQKVRRVGSWDAELIKHAVRDNGGNASVRLAITMVDQKFPELAGLNLSPAEAISGISPDLPYEVQDFLNGVKQDAGGATIALLTTGEDTGVWL